MFWKRYLDDFLIIWNRNESDLSDLNKILNDLDPDKKFTLEKNYVEIPFLNDLVRKGDNRITKGISYKSTNTHQYLHFGNSIQPRKDTCSMQSTKKFLNDQCCPLNLINDGIIEQKK